jgi:hypothetical protein
MSSSRTDDDDEPLELHVSDSDDNGVVLGVTFTGALDDVAVRDALVNADDDDDELDRIDGDDDDEPVELDVSDDDDDGVALDVADPAALDNVDVWTQTKM